MDQTQTARSVTPADIEAAIASAHYFTGRDGVCGELISDGVAPTPYEEGRIPRSLGLLTFCVLVLKNGFTVVGTSACADPALFDADVGKTIAFEDARNKVWPLLGFALRDRLHHRPALEGAIAALNSAASTCEGNAPIHAAEGRAEQAQTSAKNGVSCRLAIARLTP